MNALGGVILLGVVFRSDAATAWLLGAIAVLLSVLAAACLPSLRVSRAARIALALVAVGAVTQVIAGELLLFLTGSAVMGYAMLALGLAGPRALTRLHALAAAILLIASDLALLELVMLLDKYADGLSYADAGAAMEKVRGDALARFCLVVGFGSRVALVAMCIPEGRSSAANIATLPGWVLIGFCAAIGAVRLDCPDGLTLRCAEPLLDVLWWVPLLAVLAWQLPRAAPRLIRAVQAAGNLSSALRCAVLRVLSGLQPLRERAPETLLRMESRGGSWAVAMAAMVLLLLSLVLFLTLNLP